MVLLVVAASSGPVRVWITPPAGVTPSSIGEVPPESVAPPASVPPELGDSHHWGDVFLQLLGVLLIVFAATVAVWIVRAGLWPRRGRRGVRERSVLQVTALPEVADASWQSTLTRRAWHSLGAAHATRSSPVGCSSNAMPPQRGCRVKLPRRRRSTSNAWWRHRRSTRSPIRELAALYREARFSRHELRDDHRARASAALDRVESVLRRRAVVLT